MTEGLKLLTKQVDDGDAAMMLLTARSLFLGQKDKARREILRGHQRGLSEGFGAVAPAAWWELEELEELEEMDGGVFWPE